MLRICFCLSCVGSGMRRSPSTWFPWRYPGTVMSAPPCSWRPSSTGSPSSAEALCDYSPERRAPSGRAHLPPTPRITRRTATRCLSPLTATARARQSQSWPPTERRRQEEERRRRRRGGEEGECTNEYVNRKESKKLNF